MTKTRVLFYVQHLLGIGHLARASRLAQAMRAGGMEVTLVTGGMPVPGFPAADLPRIALPPVAVADVAFAGLVDAHGKPVDAAYMDARRDALLFAYRDIQPHIVLTEAFPFGRRQVRFELHALIDAIEATVPRPRLVASVRDILQARPKRARDEETAAVVRAHYDLVLVHGDPAFAALGDSFPLADEIADKVVHTGLVTGPRPAPSADVFDVVVSAGGGRVGAGVVREALEAAAILTDLRAWCVITGPNLPQADFDALAEAAPPSVTLTRFRADFPSLLASARVSVSQAGYNTVGDVLSAGVRSVLIPYSTQGETEQAERAAKLARLGRAVVIPEGALDGVRMAEAIRTALAGQGPDRDLAIATDGARRTVEVLAGLWSGMRPDETAKP